MIGLGVLVAVLVVDVVLGNPLQFNSALGFSPSVAGRFIGFGNAGYAALAAAALVLAGLLAHRVGGRRGAWWAVGVLVLALLADGAPIWGADVGGVLSMVPAYGITAALLLGIHVRVRTVVTFVSAAIVALAAATVFDLRKPSGHRRHLGRLIEQIQDEGFSAFSDVVRRKIDHNLMSFTTSSFRYLVLVGVVFLAYLIWWPPRHLVLLLERVPELRATLIGFAVLAVLGYGLNDAGVVGARPDARGVDLHAGPVARRAVTSRALTRRDRASGKRCRQHVIDVLGRVGASEQEPLPACAPQREQLVALHGGLHAFGDRREAERPGHVHDRADDGRVVRIRPEPGDEAAVDLDLVDGKALEVAHRGVAGAEVVDGQTDPDLVQPLRRARHLGVHQRRLGELEHQRLRADTRVG